MTSPRRTGYANLPLHGGKAPSWLSYGTPASTRDPARFALAHGGKDGTPYAVDHETYDRTIETLNRALTGAAIDRSDRVAALKRVARLAA